MKKNMSKTLAIILAALVMTGLTACAPTDNETAESTTEVYFGASVPDETTTIYFGASVPDESTTTALELEETEPEATKEDEEETGVSTAEITDVRRKMDVSFEGFKECKLIKVGDHTFYPEDLFDHRDRDRNYKDQMISQLEEADKDLHDDVYVHGIGESEVKDKYRFFGKMMKDGVIYDTGVMTCWYDEATGSAWSIDYSKFRRTDFDESGLKDAKELYDMVYERASKSPDVLRSGSWNSEICKIGGTHLLLTDATGRLLYRFTINTYSNVDVDAKTGEVVSEHYWDGVYT